MGLHGSSWEIMDLHGISSDIFACFVLFCFVLCFGKTKGNENYFQYFCL